MKLDRFDGDVEDIGNLFVSLAADDQLQNLALTVGQRLRLLIDLSSTTPEIGDDILPECGGDVSLAAQHGANGPLQFFAGVGFQHVPRGTQLERVAKVGGIQVLAQEDQLGRRTDLVDLFGRFEPVQQRHADVEDDQIRFQSFRRLDQGPAIVGLPDDLVFGAQSVANSAQYEGVVIAQKNAYFHLGSKVYYAFTGLPIGLVGKPSLGKKTAGRTPRRADRKPRRRSKQPLLGPAALLASIVDSSDDAVISKNLDGIITSWNRGAEHIYGYRAEEVIGKNISILIPPDRAEELPRIMGKIRRGERVEHFESVRIAKDKRRLSVSVTISPVRDAGGRTVGASTIARDLTAIERARQAAQESESRAHAFFQSSAQAIFIVDSAGIIVMANPATEKVFGYALGELIGKPVEVLVPQQFRAGHSEHRDRFFQNPQMRPMGLGLDLQGRRKDGKEFFVEISLSYIDSAQGTFGVALVTDISKRRADEQAIRQQGEELRALAARMMNAQDDERRRIARDLHDDLSQTLAFLAMDLGKLATKPAAQDLVADIRPLQLRAAEAAESVRRVSHQLHPSVLDDIGLEAALEQYCDEFQQRSGIVTKFISRNVPESLQREVASSIYHIAQECLRNVSKHARTKTVSVTVEFADNVLRLIIKDRGIGLKTEQPEPSGIGIVAMRERAHLVNGKLSIQSTTGSGTEVSVEVPVTASA